MTALNISFGTFGFEEPRSRDLQPVLDILKGQAITQIDTAETYGSNEADLGAAAAVEQGFIISTKNPGGWQPGVALKELELRFEASLRRLKASSVDIFYIHAPDHALPLSDWVPSVHTLYKQGKFRRFGVSNFSPEDTRALHGYCSVNGYVLPTVYQGTYNAVSRIPEIRLFPTLRELGMSFYDYSAIAGGFLTKSRAAIETGVDISSGRWALGPGRDPILSDLYQGRKYSVVPGAVCLLLDRAPVLLDHPITYFFSINYIPKQATKRGSLKYRPVYNKPSMLQALEKWEHIAQVQACPKAELAYRWVYYHSALDPIEGGDHVVVGASKLEQIEQTVEGLKRGPLKPEVVEAIDEVWELVKTDAIVDNFDAVVKQLSNA